MKISLTPTLRHFVNEQVNSGRYLDESEVVRAALRLMEAQVPVFSNLEQGLRDGGNIEDLVSLVMLEASESAQEDLKALLIGIHAINARRARLQGLIAKMTRAGAENAGGQDLQAVKEDVKSALDSLSEMGEMESLRLQMAMDRLAKLLSTLSNLLKKTSETASSLVQNLK